MRVPECLRIKSVVQEMNITLTPEEIETHLHNSSPNPREYRMTSLTCFINSERQIIKQIDVCLAPQVGGATRIIRFRVEKHKSYFLCRTSSSSTAGREARIQTGALPAVGWSVLLGFLH